MKKRYGRRASHLICHSAGAKGSIRCSPSTEDSAECIISIVVIFPSRPTLRSGGPPLAAAKLKRRAPSPELNE
jgi:hypothetical protein